MKSLAYVIYQRVSHGRIIESDFQPQFSSCYFYLLSLLRLFYFFSLSHMLMRIFNAQLADSETGRCGDKVNSEIFQLEFPCFPLIVIVKLFDPKTFYVE